VAQIASSFSSVFSLIIWALSYTTTKQLSAATVHHALLGIRQRLALGRRWFRLFRFLDAFQGASKLYVAAYASPARARKSDSTQLDPIELWLDISSRAFNGMYLVLETATMVDALQVEGLSVWSSETEQMLNVEAQRFWLFALLCAIFSGLVKILKVMAYTPVPTVSATLASEEASKNKSFEEQDMLENEKAKFDVKKEQERLRAIVKNRKKSVSQWRGDVSSKVRLLLRGVVANALDVYLPGTYVGWIQADPGTVGVLYLISTVLTGMEVWERCGREVAVRST
jgi:hypothetical protein